MRWASLLSIAPPVARDDAVSCTPETSTPPRLSPSTTDVQNPCVVWSLSSMRMWTSVLVTSVPGAQHATSTVLP